MNTKEKIQFIEEILKVYKKSDVAFFEYADENISLTLDKSVTSAPVVQHVNEVPKEKPVEVKEVINCKSEVVSPIVGTFYAAASPDKPNYVEVGSKVKKGQVLCIVEAMKLMNEITAPCDGEIGEILVNNEDGVEYNQVLFRIV